MLFTKYFPILVAHFADSTVDELLVNGSRALLLVRGTVITQVESPFPGPDVLLEWVYEFCEHQGVRIDAVHPTAGGSFEQGAYRWHAVLPPISFEDVIFCIRRQRFRELGPTSFADPYGLWPSITALMEEGCSLVICGLPGAGKSSFASALAKHLFIDDRVIIIETLPELQLLSPLWMQLCTRGPAIDGLGEVGIQRLFTESLRLRPDRIILGELRSDEIVAFEQARHCFTRASLTTMHASDLTRAQLRYTNLLKHFYTGLPADNALAYCLIERGQPPKLADLCVTRR